MFAFGLVAKGIVCAKLLLVLGYFITRSELSSEPLLYPSRISLGPLIEATDEELLDIAQQIWKADVDGNRMKDDDVQFKYIKDKKFFTKVIEAAWKNKLSYTRLIELFSNYDTFTGTNVTRDRDLLDRVDAFLEAILKTDPIETLYIWLNKKGPLTREKFKQDLHQYWFTTYNRAGVLSSGFRHTFVGEIYGDEVNGFHNWVRMYKEEQAERLHVTARLDNDCCEPSVEVVVFCWKPSKARRRYCKFTSSSLFIRTSPEVQIALSTLCLLTRPNGNCRIKLDGNPLNLNTIPKMVNGKKAIYTSYPLCPKHVV